MTEHVSATIGATPLIKLERLSEEIGATVYVKFEASNPGGSIKDRAAMNMIDAAEDRGADQWKYRHRHRDDRGSSWI